MADIFISYAREDWDTAKTLAQALADQGWSVWWDRHIPSGRRFHEVIERELTAARCVIALWSTAALGSPWVREEAQDGLDRDILVPARIETVRLPIGFRTIQTADLSDWGEPGSSRLRAIA
jgi:TIR domain